jgi:SAM-dependent methyltransferase
VDIRDLVRDELGAPGYDELVAQAYDTWLPPDGRYSDVALWRRFIEEGHGPALELGSGTGRLLLGYVDEGLDVEGVEKSEAMLEICHAHARERGIDVVVHHVDWLTLDLPRRYATIYNPAGSFALLDGDDEARAALRVWLAHLAPGGRLVIGSGVPTVDLDANYDWRVRRSATRPSDGITFMVHEAFRFDEHRRVQHILNRHEVWDPAGRLLSTVMRRIRLHWWSSDEMTALLRASGAAEVEIRGGDDAFLAVARAAAE